MQSGSFLAVASFFFGGLFSLRERLVPNRAMTFGCLELLLLPGLAQWGWAGLGRGGVLGRRTEWGGGRVVLSFSGSGGLPQLWPGGEAQEPKRRSGGCLVGLAPSLLPSLPLNSWTRSHPVPLPRLNLNALFFCSTSCVRRYFSGQNLRNK